MFGIDGSELLVIAIVAVIVIGPRDMPKMLRGLAAGIARLRGFQQMIRGQLDETLRRADMQGSADNLRGIADSIRNFTDAGAGGGYKHPSGSSGRDECARYAENIGRVQNAGEDAPLDMAARADIEGRKIALSRQSFAYEKNIGNESAG